MWVFQLLPSMPQQEEPTTITVNDDVLQVLGKRAETLIAGDPSFREAVLDALQQAKVRRAERKVEDVVSDALDMAKYKIRKELSGKTFSGPFALSSRLLEIITEVQMRVLGQISGTLGSESGDDHVESSIASRISELMAGKEDEARKQAEEELELVDERSAELAKHGLGVQFLRGRSFQQLLHELREELPEWMEYKLLSLERDRCLDLCRTMVKAGRMYRFELNEVAEIMDMLLERPLPRSELASKVEQLVQRRLERSI